MPHEDCCEITPYGYDEERTSPVGGAAKGGQPHSPEAESPAVPGGQRMPYDFVDPSPKDAKDRMIAAKDREILTLEDKVLFGGCSVVGKRQRLLACSAVHLPTRTVSLEH